MWRTHLRRFFLVIALVVVIGSGYELMQRQLGFSKAQEFAQFGLWERARNELARYLQLHPRDDQARFAMAECWIKDDKLLSTIAAPQAISNLERIPNTSPLAAEARTSQAKLELLVLHKPAEAERLLRQSLLLDANSLETHLILLKLLELTGRQDFGEPIFWRIYEMSPPADRALRLRDWYMSQFFPMTANESLERQMGFTSEASGKLSPEAMRYVRFRETEPSKPLGRATLARWTRQMGSPQQALSILNLDDAKLDNELQDTFFVTTLVDSLIDLGEFEQADQHFQRWPGSRDGFNYWRLKAIILEEVHGDFEHALEAYNRALETWPGPVDWRLMHRHAECLAKAGHRSESIQARKHADEILKLMHNDVHRRLRQILGFLDNPENLREVADFYRKINRSREADAWDREVSARVAKR